MTDGMVSLALVLGLATSLTVTLPVLVCGIVWRIVHMWK